MSKPVFICDACDEVTAVCPHLDERIEYLESIQWKLENMIKSLQDAKQPASNFPSKYRLVVTLGELEGLLDCPHPHKDERGFCPRCRIDTTKKDTI
jgi:hypothetical protein